MNKQDQKTVNSLLSKLKAAIAAHDDVANHLEDIRLELLELVTAPRKKP